MHTEDQLMNWDDLKYFLAVAREGSISGAGQKLGVQHSTVSRRLRSLEKQMNTQLVERKNSGYELTSAGEILKSTALSMESELLKADGALTDKESQLAGKLRVTAFSSMASTLLMPMFARFTKKYPKIELHIKVSNTHAKLSEREADIALRLTNKPRDTLIGKRLVTIASTVYGSQKYLKKLETDGIKPTWLGALCCEYHQKWTQLSSQGTALSFYTDDTMVTQAALREDMGLAYLPCFSGDADPVLERYCLPEEKMALGLWLLFHPDFKRNAKILAFRKHMVEEISQEMALFEGKLQH